MTAFEKELGTAQMPLLSYINVLCGVPQDAEDILGEVNLALIRARGLYDSSRPFMPWARTFAFHAVQHWWTAQQRSRMVPASQILDLLKEDLSVGDGDTDGVWQRRLDLLDEACRELTPEMRYLIVRYYTYNESLATIGHALNRTPGALAVSLHYLRGVLRRSIEKKLGRET